MNSLMMYRRFPVASESQGLIQMFPCKLQKKSGIIMHLGLN